MVDYEKQKKDLFQNEMNREELCDIIIEARKQRDEYKELFNNYKLRFKNQRILFEKLTKEIRVFKNKTKELSKLKY